MTREEARRIAQGLITDFKCESEIMVEFCNIVIEALKQMDVIDKIKAEIESMDFDFGDYYDHTEKIQEMVLGIIDKYRKVEE